MKQATRAVQAVALAAAVIIAAASTASAQPEEELAGLIETLIVEPLAAFRAEPPRTCESRNLAKAHLFAAEIADVMIERSRASPGGPSLWANSLAAGLLLDVADTAAERGCPEIARRMYRDVIATYTGSGYAAHRQRAEIGLAELRALGGN